MDPETYGTDSINPLPTDGENIPFGDRNRYTDQRSRTFNGLSAKEWAARSRSVWNDVSYVRRTKARLDHGATFPEALAQRLIEMYSRTGDTVLDPFLGTGTTVVSALKTNRNAIGIELTEHYYAVAEESVSSLENISSEYQLFNGNCENVLRDLDDGSVQLTVTSPPYADLIRKVTEDRALRHKNSILVKDNGSTIHPYSDSTEDLGNMPLEEYLEHVDSIMKELYRVTAKGGYNVWVVKDFRDVRNGVPYVDLHTKIAESGTKAGFRYHDLIIWDQNEHRKLVVNGYPSVFYMNINHSFVVVMRK